MDVRVPRMSLRLCLGSALVCSLLPAWQASRPGLVATLNDAARGSTGRPESPPLDGHARGRSGRAGPRAPDRSRADDAEPARPAAHRRRCRNRRSHADGLRSPTTGLRRGARRLLLLGQLEERLCVEPGSQCRARRAMRLSAVPRFADFASKARQAPSLATFRWCLWSVSGGAISMSWARRSSRDAR